MFLEYLALTLTSLSLGTDAFCVSITDGLVYEDINKKKAILIAVIFGLFQGVMPLIGYYAGSAFYEVIKEFDHWIALGILAFIGGKMIIEGIISIKKHEIEATKKFSYKEVVIQGIATSIDALVAGFAFLSSTIHILIDSLFISVITFGMCLFGLFFGKAILKLLKGKVEIATIIGGAVLILIGIKIVLEHTLG